MSEIVLDKEGFLVDLDLWSEKLAKEIAQAENLELNEAHWEIIFLVRNFYKDFERSPNMRALVNYLKKQLGEGEVKNKANSIYLLKLFPGSPAKLVSKIAGLPKPDNCL
jgi:tRNA 2-thiouridine synthesizing protein E